MFGGFENVRRAARLGALLAVLCALPAGGQTISPAPLSPPQVPPAAYEIVDEAGRRVTVPHEAQHIVSLAPSVTETIYALGLGDRLVGVTDYCDFPAEAQTKRHVGGPVNPNLEQIVALRPDLVVATRQINRRETVDALERLGIAVFTTDPRSVEGVIASAERLGRVLGVPERGERLAAQLRERMAELQRRLGNQPRVRVFFVVWPEPLISIGRNTFLADALRWAGAESVVETQQDWPRVNIEEVVRQRPDYLVFSSSHSEETVRTVEHLRERPGWRSLDAVREGRVAIISDAVNRPSPRLVDAIEQLAKQLHPQSFTREQENGKVKFEIKPISLRKKLERRDAVPPPRLRAGANFEFRISSLGLLFSAALVEKAR